VQPGEWTSHKANAVLRLDTGFGQKHVEVDVIGGNGLAFCCLVECWHNMIGGGESQIGQHIFMGEEILTCIPTQLASSPDTVVMH
jgi:hypothetical protein